MINVEAYFKNLSLDRDYVYEYGCIQELQEDVLNLSQEKITKVYSGNFILFIEDISTNISDFSMSDKSSIKVNFFMLKFSNERSDSEDNKYNNYIIPCSEELKKLLQLINCKYDVKSVVSIPVYDIFQDNFSGVGGHFIIKEV